MSLEDRPNSDTGSSAANAKARKVARQATNQGVLGLELPFVLVGTIALGAALGYFLDRWLNTKPILMFVFGALGFVGGVREILRRLPGDADGGNST
jgi:ATP synthase protein I